MAKKKQQESSSEDAVSQTCNIDMLIKKFGAGVFQSGEQIISKEKIIVPMSPSLDIIIDRGVPFGSVITLAGQFGGGKTLTALSLARNAQMIDKNAYVLYLNVEARLERRDLVGIKDLDISSDRFQLVGSFRNEDGGKILTAEDFLEIAEYYINNRPKTVIIIDSISMLTTAKERECKLGENNYGGGLMSKFLKRNSNGINVNEIMVIGITQMTTNMGYGNGPSKIETGGEKVKFAKNIGLQITHVEDWRTNKEDPKTKIGQKVHWKTNKTCGNIGPGQEITSYIRYGTGIDENMELFELGVTAALINKSGAWYTHEYMQNHLDVLGVEEWNAEAQKLCRGQGAENAAQLLYENPEWATILKKQIRNLFFGE